jgi:hypothetical protein
MVLDLVSQAFSLGYRNRALQAQNLDATTYCFATKKVDDLRRGEKLSLRSSQFKQILLLNRGR